MNPGYSIQIGVGSEYIMGVGAFTDRNDTNTLILFMESTEKNLNHSYESVTMDSGYENKENYLWLEQNGKVYYIKPQIYKMWKNRGFKKILAVRKI